MTRERLLELATLVADALDIIEEKKLPHNVEISVGRYPEIWVHENIQKCNENTHRFYGYRDFDGQERDTDLNLAEAYLRELIGRMKNE